MSRRFLYSLQWPVILLVAMLAGGQTAHRTVCAEGATEGDALVTFTASGKAIVFVIGALAGLVGMAILGYAPLRLRLRVPWNVHDKLRQTAILLVIAPIVSAGFAMIAMLLLAPLFFAMPRGVVDFITTHP